MPAMKKLRLSSAYLSVALAATLVLSGCSKKTSQNQPSTAEQQQQQQPQQYPQQQAPNAPAQQATNPGSSAPTQSAPSGAMAPAPPQPAAYTIPRGTHIRVTLNQELGSKISQPGESFSATVASPIVVDGRTIVRTGSSASGTVIAAKALGRFKGQAQLAIRLDSIRAGGQRYEVETSSIDRVEKGKGKRTAVMTGGGGGFGAIIGGLAGGGKGALIGGLAGAGAGGAGSAFTGNKEIVIPAETPITFRLEHSVTVSR